LANPQPAPPGEVAAALPGARLQGHARLRVWGFSVYDARLWTTADADGFRWSTAPIALELAYLRSFSSEQLADRSLLEMRRQAEIEPAKATRWLQALKNSLPDVKAGDRVTGIHNPGAGARLYFNGSPKAELTDPELARMFFAIWLGPQCSEPAMRDALLGPSASGKPRP
jgi:hypothetical protein